MKQYDEDKSIIYNLNPKSQSESVADLIFARSIRAFTRKK